MIPSIENAVLGTLLDCQEFNLLNAGVMIPVPDGLVDITDPTLYDPRVPPAASVTDESVNANAGISQQKLLFNLNIPVGWLGNSSNQAAEGDLVELVAKKGVSNGYAALDATGKLPSSHVTTGAGTGTVNFVGLSMPPEFIVSNSPILSSGAFSVAWEDAPSNSWFGVYGADLDATLSPSFIPGQIPVGIVPSLDASKFTSGVFPVELFPVTTGTSGVLPDPGEIGDPTDYFASDMQYHPFSPPIANQPACPQPVITLLSWSDTENLVTVSSPLEGSSVLVRINSGPWQPKEDTYSVEDGDIVWAYAAKAGYNNSDLASWKVVTPLT